MAQRPPFLTRTAYTQVEANAGTHKPEFSLLAVQALGLAAATDKHMMMGFTKNDAESIYHLRHAQDIKDGFVVLAPMTTWSSKCWSAERWTALGDALAKDNRQVVLIGSSSEAEEIRQ